MKMCKVLSIGLVCMFVVSPGDWSSLAMAEEPASDAHKAAEGNVKDEPADSAQSISIANRCGVRWDFQHTADGWSLGTIQLNGKPLEAPVSKGMIALRNVKSGKMVWLPASSAKQIDALSAHFSGKTDIDGVTVSFQVDVSLSEDMPACDFIAQWNVNRRLEG